MAWGTLCCESDYVVGLEGGGGGVPRLTPPAEADVPLSLVRNIMMRVMWGRCESAG